MVLLFYSTIGFLIFLLGVKAFSAAKELIGSLPDIYAYYVEPALISSFDSFEQSIFRIDDTLLSAFMELETQFVQSAGQMVSSLSMDAMGHISGFASSLPGLFIELLLVIISTFFIALDYHHLTGFCLMQLNGKAKDIFFQIKEYVVGTLLVCIRSYALIMTITFVELAVGLSVIGVENPVLIAFLIALFDILPVLGTGGIMIPWTGPLGALAGYALGSLFEHGLDAVNRDGDHHYNNHAFISISSQFTICRVYPACPPAEQTNNSPLRLR